MDEGSARKTETANSFGDSADKYLGSRTHREGEDLELLATWCEDGTWALDIATDAGHTAGAFTEAGPYVMATDASPSMVATSVDVDPGVHGGRR